MRMKIKINREQAISFHEGYKRDLETAIFLNVCIWALNQPVYESSLTGAGLKPGFLVHTEVRFKVVVSGPRNRDHLNKNKKFIYLQSFRRKNDM